MNMLRNRNYRYIALRWHHLKFIRFDTMSYLCEFVCRTDGQTEML